MATENSGSVNKKIKMVAQEILLACLYTSINKTVSLAHFSF
ncbi:MAG: hypothetical protein ABJB11_24715 [Ferruginibacter sp.]